MRGQDQEAVVSVSLEEAFFGAAKSLALETAELDDRGHVQRATRHYDVKIPPGTGQRARIRLSGQGGRGVRGGPAGDLYLRVHITPHPQFHLSGRHLVTDLSVTPWEAALGAKLPVRTMKGIVTVSVPSGTQSGQKLRLRGQGLPRQGAKPAGDLLVAVRVAIPRRMSAKEKELFRELARQSPFNPRK
jgi:curved DNA-binding protein